MNVIVRLKFQLDTRCNLAARKSDEHTKHRVCSLIQSLFATNLPLSSLKGGKTYKQKDINRCRTREIDADLDIHFSAPIVFCGSFCTCLFGAFSSHPRVWAPSLPFPFFLSSVHSNGSPLIFFFCESQPEADFYF